MKNLIVLIIFAFSGLASNQKTELINQKKIVDLKVGIYSWIPESAYAIELLESQFEQKYPHIDLDLKLVDSYEDTDLESIQSYDIFEIDLIRLDELIEGNFNGIDKIPKELREDNSFYVGGASKVMQSNQSEYVVPHWVCGNFLITWKENNPTEKKFGFNELRKILNPIEFPIYSDLFGGGTLGEYYADAVLDIYGTEKAKEHFLEIAKSENNDFMLLDTAINKILSLINELPVDFRDNLSQYHSLPSIYPESFAKNKKSFLLGYSERLYYVEKELQFEPGSGWVPIIKSENIIVQQFSFGDESKGTPSWVDGFVIPKGKCEQKKQAIIDFLRYIRTDEGYLPFLKPHKWGPATNLLPAVRSVYDSLANEVPLIKKFLEVFDDSFVITDKNIYRGIDQAGERIKKKIADIYIIANEN